MEITISLLIFCLLNLLIVCIFIYIFNIFLDWLDVYVNPKYSSQNNLLDESTILSLKEKILFFLLELFIAISLLFIIVFVSPYVILVRVMCIYYLKNYVFAFYNVMLEVLIKILVGIGVVWNMIFGFYGTLIVIIILLIIFLMLLTRR